MNGNPLAATASTLLFLGLLLIVLGVAVWFYEDLLRAMVSGAFVLLGLLLAGLGARLRQGPPSMPGGPGMFGGGPFRPQ